jgi:Raf kinase inhibitor-like YbhB/YbcL family protein
MKITSSAFANYGDIPSRYTCDGENISPPLQWEGVPEGTKSLTLICDDPDAPKGVWDHWIIFNLPVQVILLPEGIKKFSPETKLGKNSWGKENYGGPCPPDKKHRYFFKLYALDTFLKLSNGSTKEQIKQSMKKHVIEEAELVGLYARPWQKE